MDKLYWITKKVKVKELIELDFNPRKISEEKQKKLQESLSKFNLVEIPAVNFDMKIIGGNQRVKILMLAGRGNDIIDVRYPNRLLTDEEVKEYNLISNSHAGEFDLDILHNSFADINLDDIGFDLSKIEFESSDFYNKAVEKFDLRNEIKSKSKGEEDDFNSDEPVTTSIEKGDCFKIGNHRLICADSFSIDELSVLFDNRKASFVFTDPPYDLKSEDYVESINYYTNDAHVFVMHDDLGIINYLKRSTLKFKRFFVSDFQFSSPRGNDPYLQHILISHEEKGVPIKHENMYDGLTSIIKLEYRFRNKEENFGHKHQKPIKFISIFLNHYSKEGQICLDLFGGVGSTMAACQQLNRICYMSELDPVNCQKIINRMEKCYNIKAIKL